MSSGRNYPLSVLPSESPCGSSGKKATCLRTLQLALLVAVRFAERIAFGSSGKKATLRSVAYGSAVRFAKRIAYGSSGKKATCLRTLQLALLVAVRFAKRIAFGSSGKTAPLLKKFDMIAILIAGAYNKHVCNLNRKGMANA